MTLRANSGGGYHSFGLSFHCQLHCFHFLKLWHRLWIHCYNCGCEVFPAGMLNNYADVGDRLDNIDSEDGSKL